MRNYAIEEGYIATKPNKITETSNFVPLEELSSNAFDPRIRTELFADEWDYATARVNEQVQAKPSFITDDPYEAVPFGVNIEALFDRKPAEVQLAKDVKPEEIVQLRQKVEKQRQSEAKFSPEEQTLIMEALLTEPARVQTTVKPWLKRLDEMGNRLKLEDLADKNGPLGLLLYYHHSSTHSHRTGRKFAFEAAPTIVEYFKEMATPVPFSHFTETKIAGETLIERMRKAQDIGIEEPYEQIVKHYRL